MDVIFSGVRNRTPIVKEVNKFPANCSSCPESAITFDSKYLRCKLSGGCYIPCMVKERRPNDCSLKLKKER